MQWKMPATNSNVMMTLLQFDLSCQTTHPEVFENRRRGAAIKISIREIRGLNIVTQITNMYKEFPTSR